MESEPMATLNLAGYKRDPKWTDMSDWLVHFTRNQESLASILATKMVRADRPLGWAVYYPEIVNQNSACFSEVPIKDMNRLINHRSAWGIAFRRDFIVNRGGNRVWYLEDETPVYRQFEDWARTQRNNTEGQKHPLWAITPFIDRLQPGRHEWDWEREWRVPGGLKFVVSDIAFIITPGTDVSALVTKDIPAIATWFPSGDEESYWQAFLSALATSVDRHVASFLDTWEPAPLAFIGGELAPGLILLETDEAVERHLGHLEDGVREEVMERLNAESTEWFLPEREDQPG